MAGFLAVPWAGNLKTYALMQDYGPTTFTSEPSLRGYAHYHTGLDFGLPQGTPVLCPADGTVIVAGVANNTGRYYTWGFGDNVLLIQHANNIITLYGHMSSLSVTQGASVKRGQQLGLSGGAQEGAGNSTGPHLHFECNNGWYDPTSPWPLLDTSNTLAIATPYAAGQSSQADQVTYAQIITWARNAGIPETQLPLAAAVAMAESSLRIDAENVNANGSTDYGLWQINSVHIPPYVASQLISDGQYNAKAAYDISTQGTDWRPWSTYNSGAYAAYLNDATAAWQATPPGTPVALPTFNTLPVDTPPQLPANTYSITPQQVAPSALVTVPNAEAVALLAVRGYYIPVTTMEVTLPYYTAAGSFTAQTELGWLHRQENQSLVDILTANSPTQATCLMGYVPDTSQAYSPDQLVPLLVGLLTAEFDHQDVLDDLTLSGPDLSGIFSSPDATPQKLNQQQNMTSDKVVAALVKAHNPAGQTGLTVQAATTTTVAGSAFSANSIQTVQVGQTEWDIITKLAANEGYVAFMSGTTLYWGPLPPEQPPLILPFGLFDGRQISDVTGVNIKLNPHSKRDYNIVVTSYNQRSGKNLQVQTGNNSAATTMTFPQAVNLSQDALNKIAASYLQYYSATEVICTVTIDGIIQLAPGQPIAIASDRLIAKYRHPYMRFYPTSVKYRYDQGQGFTMTLTCTNRPFGIQSKDPAQANIFGF